ncbi:MAG: hypothetical protein ABJD07_01585 [Gemmatimonadaceae bacterium]
MQRIVARAPTRIDFGGGWTDVPPYTTEHGGCVCNLAIARHAEVTIIPAPGRVILDEDGRVEEAASPSAFARDGGPLLMKAALRCASVGDIRVGLRSDFPFGAGLGGSSAAGVALAGALAEYRGETLSREEVAERSRATEAQELGIAGGKQDHYAAAFGGALGLRFGETVTVHPIALNDRLAAELEQRCVLAYTGQSRISGDTIAAVLDAYRAREPRVTRALARMKALAESMIEALEHGSIDDLGLLVAEHWTHQRAMHPTITTLGIERVMEAARAAGALGGKALGASGGGCVVVIAPENEADAVRAAVGTVADVLPFTIDRDGLAVASRE